MAGTMMEVEKDVAAIRLSMDDSDEELEEEEYEEEVELGFVEKIQQPLDAKLLHENPDWSEWDGGLVGGKPKWLNPTTIPSTDDLACTACNNPLSFLLQIYCPLDDEADAFHRSLYVFCCRQPKCSQQGSGKVFRTQLPQVNDFFAPDRSTTRATVSSTPSLCALCGHRAIFTCSACHIAQYCCKQHQKDHWKSGHQSDCVLWYGANEQKIIESDSVREHIRTYGTKCVFPSYVMEIESEPNAGEAVNDNEKKLLADFEKAKQMAGATRTGDESDLFTDDSEIDLSQKDLNQALGSTATQDKDYIRFLTRVELAKDQVFRYARWQDHSVVWVHSQAKCAPSSVPPCELCGNVRKYECQVMPQLLSYLRVDQTSSLQQIEDKSCEWGTLVIYTCTKSCALNGAYTQEYLHYQTPYTGAT